MFDPGAEFDRQVRALVAAGHPELCGRSERWFRSLVRPLRALVADLPRADPTPERLPFLLVTTLPAAAAAMVATRWRGRAGIAAVTGLDQFVPIKEADVPAAPAYLVLDVDRGSAHRNVTPDDALAAITLAGRTPLTVQEGIALVTVSPASLERNHCFSLAGSRCGDRRVPAIWISQSAPKLGWCWAGNPHTWLGCASAANRTVPEQRDVTAP